MVKYIKAIIFKEFTVFKKKLVFNLFNLLGLSIFFSVIYIVRVMAFKNLNPEPIGLYLLIMIGYISFVQNLKFWQEKLNNSLERILATDIPIKIFLIGKLIFPLMISIILIVINYLSIKILSYLLFNQILLNFRILLYAMYISLLFNFCFGVINGYSMWCGSMLQAKVMQIITVLIYSGSLISTFIYNPDRLDLKVINTFLGFFIVISFIFFIKINKEKTVLNLLE